MKYTYISLCLLAALLLGACSVDKYNDNPNNPTSVDPQAIMPAILFNAAKNAYPWQASLAVQHTTAVSDAQTWQTYQWSNGDWQEFNYLRSINSMMEEAKKRPGMEAYTAVGKILRAHLFFFLTRMYGDIPYKDALAGNNSDAPDDRFAPAYDDQRSIILGLLNELEEANQLLKNNPPDMAADIIYGGKADKWRKLANSYKLRILLMLSNKMDDAELKVKERFNAILTNPAEYPIFENASDEARLNYRNTDNVRYPLYNFLDVRNKRFMGKSLCDLMKSLHDERLFVYAQQTENSRKSGTPATDFNAYNGIDASQSLPDIGTQASTGDYSRINTAHYTESPTGDPSLFLSYAEVMLAIAEAGTRGWVSVDAGAYYNKAVTAAFEFYGLGSKAAAYLAQAPVKWDATNGLTQVYQQRNILFYFQDDFEPLFHYHRTGYPVIKCGPGQASAKVPYRQLYPVNETNVNKQHMTEAINRQGYTEDNIMNKIWLYK